MLEISCLDDIAALRETADIECKLAAGKDGQPVGCAPRTDKRHRQVWQPLHPGNVVIT